MTTVKTHGKLIWVAYTMFWEYYISLVDGSIYKSEGNRFNPKPCTEIPDRAEFITYAISY